MPGPDPAVAAIRLAVRTALRDNGLRRVILGCSGGADSTALAAAVAFEAPKLDAEALAMVVDHGLQDGSAQIAQDAAERVRRLGLSAQVVAVEVADSKDGPEAAARAARYAALREAAARTQADAILLGHTQDDQAESVLLGLVRGSGLRSIAAMAPAGHGLVRPLLRISRQQTRQACAAEGLVFWDDPHNDDPRFSRVRVRRALAHLEGDLGPGLIKGLARTADLARQDADHLDAETAALQDRLGGAPWPVEELTGVPIAIRTRWWRGALAAQGAVIADLSSTHVASLETLLTGWRGQGPVDVPGRLRVRRGTGQIHVEPSGQVE